MEGLVNYSSEEDQDDYRYTKVAIRERGNGGAAIAERTATEVSATSLKRSYEHSKSSGESATSRKSRDGGSDRFKSGNTFYNEDKYKIDRRAEKPRNYKEKRDSRESKNIRDTRTEERDYDYGQKYDNKKIDDHRRYREPKKDYKRDDNDYHNRDEKRYNRYDERKSSYVANSKDRFYSKPRYDDRSNDERRSTNDERRGNGPNIDDRRKEFNEKRNFNNDDDRKSDRRYDDRRTQRSYIDDRSNVYRLRRSNSPLPSYNKSSEKYSERREDSSKRRERKRYSRSRSRSRSRSGDNTAETNLASINNSHHLPLSSEHSREIKLSDTDTQISERKSLPNARNFETLLSLPLGENASKNPKNVTVPATSAAVGANTTTAAVQLPSYYNPNVINPNKYVEQMQKRKLIWGAKKSEDCSSKWGHAQFSQDQDGKVASKFMRLMGIKSSSGTGGESSTSPNETEKNAASSTPPNTDVKSREAMFSTMEHQYEVARQVTHTMRGVGLGFSSQPRPF